MVDAFKKVVEDYLAILKSGELKNGGWVNPSPVTLSKTWCTNWSVVDKVPFAVLERQELGAAARTYAKSASAESLVATEKQLVLSMSYNDVLPTRSSVPDIWTAAQTGDVEVLLSLLKNGADVNGRAHGGDTPLYYACKGGQIECLQVLLSFSPDVNLKNSRGRTALHKAAIHGHAACAMLLITNGADVNAQDIDGLTPLHLAAAFGHPYCGQVLITHGHANTKVADNNGRIPEELASSTLAQPAKNIDRTAPANFRIVMTLPKNRRYEVAVARGIQDGVMTHEWKWIREHFTQAIQDFAKAKLTEPSVEEVVVGCFARIADATAKSKSHLVAGLRETADSPVRLPATPTPLKRGRARGLSVSSRNYSCPQLPVTAPTWLLPREEGLEYGKDSGGHVVIISGTKEKLFEKLVDPDYTDENYPLEFLLTHPYFMTGKELLEGLCERYFVTVDDPSLSHKDRALKEELCKFRVLHVLSIWIEYRFEELTSEDPDVSMVSFILDFCDRALAQTHGKKLTEELQRIIQMVTFPEDIERLYESMDSYECPEGVVLSDMYYSPKDIDPYAMACQLTLYEHERFRMIAPSECVCQRFATKDKAKLMREAPNIAGMIDRFNQITQWVGTCILREPQVKRRAHLICQFIKISKHLMDLNNFNTALAMLGGLSIVPVSRLRDTWAYVPQDVEDVFEDIRQCYSYENNYKNYREKIAAVEPPLIPFAAMMTKDWFLIDETNEIFKENGNVSFEVLRMMAQAIQKYLRYQKTMYYVEECDEMDGFFGRLEIVDEKTLFNMSVEHQPLQY